MSERLRIRGAHRAFGEDAGLFGVDLSVGRGEVLALIGLNGAGKTTLMRAVLGMLRLGAGEVRIDGTALQHLASPAWRRVGHLVEHPFAYPELSVSTNLDLAARLHGLAAASVPEARDAAIADLDLGRYAGVVARRLSQGNLQRLGLAVALQHHPDLLVLDEPTNALDPDGVIRLREALLRRAGDGAGVLVSSHHLDEVARIADQIQVINHGTIVGSLATGTPDLERALFELVRADDERRRP